MKLPTHLTMRQTAHGSGARGLAFYEYEDAAGLGVQMQARRESYGAAFVETWYHVALPERSFGTFAELAGAVDALTDEQIAAEAANYPRFRSIKPDSCGNPCRLCPRPTYSGGPRVHHDTWRVTVARNWRRVTDSSCSLCKAHRIEFDGRAADLLAALQSEADARKARARLVL
jgi:hypothetical protein